MMTKLALSLAWYEGEKEEMCFGVAFVFCCDLFCLPGVCECVHAWVCMDVLCCLNNILKDKM